MTTLTILLDTNEFIFGLTKPQESSAQLLGKLPYLSIKLPRFILNELHDNLSYTLLKELYQLIREAEVEVIEEKIPASMVKKYQKQLPPEDAIIAAYCEFLRIEILISENRHFLVDFHPKAFRVLSAHEFIEQYILTESN